MLKSRDHAMRRGAAKTDEGFPEPAFLLRHKTFVTRSAAALKSPRTLDDLTQHRTRQHFKLYGEDPNMRRSTCIKA
jgi:hypothetical protein